MNVLIDPGHGGNDPGCVWEEAKTKELIFEKDINMTIAEQVIGFLPDHVRTKLSRRKDDYVSLKDRAVTTFHYDLLVSIHTNAIEKKKQSKVAGMEVHVADNADPILLAIAREFLNEVSKAAKIEPNQPNPIRSSPGFRVLALAEKLRDRSGRSRSCLRPAVHSDSHGEKGKGTPAILLELGYLTSAVDRKQLVNPIIQKAIAKAIATVITMLAPSPGEA